MAIIPIDPTLVTKVAQTTAAQEVVPVASQVAPNATLQIATTQILPTQAPDLKIGDIIQFLVKDVKANNIGLLYFFGQLIEAKVPPGLKNGDIVRAEVQRQHESVILKIKEIIATTDSHTPPDNAFIIETDSNLTELLSHKVEFLLKTLDAVLNKSKVFAPHQGESANILPFPVISNEVTDNVILKELEKGLLILQKTIPKDILLTNSKAIKEAIQTIQDGSLVEDINLVVAQLNATIEKSTITHEGKFFIELLKRLPSLRDLALDSNSSESFNLDLKKLILVIGRELENIDLILSSQTTAKTSFKITLNQIKSALENLQNLDSKEEQTSALDSLIKQTEAQVRSSFPLDLRSKEDIINTTKKMLGNLESLVQSQEMLNRLEPILQSLKEPQLLLFPFLLSGMMGFGELIVDPDGGNKSQNQQSKGKRDKSKNTFSYQGVVPLPNLGQVQFNAMQTDSEIELFFTLEDEEKMKFFEANLTDLRAELLSAGLTSNNISLGTAVIKKPTLDGLEVDEPLIVL